MSLCNYIMSRHLPAHLQRNYYTTLNIHTYLILSLYFQKYNTNHSELFGKIVFF